MSQVGPELTLGVYPSNTVTPRQQFRFSGGFLNWVNGLPRPLPNKTIYLYRNGVNIASTVTDVGGAYAFPWMFEASADAFNYHTTGNGASSPTIVMTVTSTTIATSITISTTTPNLRVGEVAVLSGTLTDEYGQPVQGVYINLLVNDVVSPLGNFPTDQFGGYLIDFPLGTVDPGVYDLKARFPGAGALRASTSTPITVTIQKDQTTLTLTVDPISGVAPLTITATGQLKGATTGNGLANKQIKLLIDDVPVASTQTDSGGNYSIQYTISVVKFNYAIQTEFSGDIEYEGCEET